MARHVAIIGGGFSGTMLAVQLLRAGARVTLIERAGPPGRGLAYSAADPTHLLNVRAANMSADPDDPAHLSRWLEERGVAEPGTAFAPRRLFGAYVEEQLAQARAAAPDRLEIIAGNARDLETGPEGVQVTLADRPALFADAAVLATGNLPPPPPPGLQPDQLAAGRYWGDPWAPGATEELDSNRPVLVVGSGLTMVDIVLLLDAKGFTGPIIALSRRGLIPRAHAAEPPPADRRTAAPDTGASALVRDVRSRAARIGWRHAIDELRPFTQSMWQSATPAQRGRFLRHLRPWWDVHRHRIAPSIAQRIHALIERGQLRVVAGKLVGAADAPGGVEVGWRPRGSAAAERLLVQRIVNCTGPEGNIPRSPEPLLRSLVARGAIRPGPCGIGVEVDAGARVVRSDGTADPRLHAVGPLTRGMLWEIVAVPDIRVQVAALARRLAGHG